MPYLYPVRLAGKGNNMLDSNFGRPKRKRPVVPDLLNHLAPVCTESFVADDLLHGDEVPVQRFVEQGFIKVRGLFSLKEVMRIKAELARFMRDRGPTLPDYDRMEMVPGKVYPLLGRLDYYDDFFRDLLLDPRVVNIVKRLLGGEVLPRHIQFFNMIPGFSPATPPHQDAAFSGETEGHLNIWMPLVPVGDANGCLHYIPGSHRFGLRPHERIGERGPPMIAGYSDEDRAREVAVHTELGDAIIHGCLAVHGAGVNKGDEERHALGFPFFKKHIGMAPRDRGPGLRH